MKKILTIIAFFTVNSLLLTANCQNLVPNPSFEEYYSCPTGTTLIYLAKGWNNYLSPPYYGSTSNTCDYFNVCGSGDAGIPTNWHGSQYPSSGDAYAGAFCYANPPSLNDREYFGVKLTDTLIKRQKYRVSLSVSLAEGYNCGINKLGILFMTDSFNYTEPNNYAQVYFETIITDYTNWVTLSKSFIADSNYKYLVIGNFFTDDSTDFIKLYDIGSDCVAYYYFDDIYVDIDTTSDNIDNYNKNQINIYPNPFSTQAVLQLCKDTYLPVFQLFDISGKDVTKLVKIELIENNRYILYKQELSPGLYFLKIQNENITTINKLIIN